MEPTKTILIIDAAINLVLGLLLLLFPPQVVDFLGVPGSEHRFYPSILGAVLSGIGIALLVECLRRSGSLVGLGLGGAIAINLCGGLALAGWLAVGELDIAARGRVFLWALATILVVVSSIEVLASASRTGKAQSSLPGGRTRS
jgi:uncharacterized membrane protein